MLLVSADFLDSDYCWDVETKRAMERHEAGESRVIPVILRSCDWHTAPFGKLQALPKDGKPVASWTNRDEAFTDVARGIREAVKALASGTQASQTPAQPVPAVTWPAGRPRTIDQSTLVLELGELDHADWASLVAMIPRAAKHVSRHGTVPEQVAELVRSGREFQRPWALNRCRGFRRRLRQVEAPPSSDRGTVVSGKPRFP